MWWVVGSAENGWVLVEGLYEVPRKRRSGGFDVGLQHGDGRFMDGLLMEDVEDLWIMVTLKHDPTCLRGCF